MKPRKGTPEPVAADQLETFGGDYHRLEGTYRPAEKPPPAPRAREKGQPRDKPPRKLAD